MCRVVQIVSDIVRDNTVMLIFDITVGAVKYTFVYMYLKTNDLNLKLFLFFVRK